MTAPVTDQRAHGRWLPGLTATRFWAAAIVVIYHTDIRLSEEGYGVLPFHFGNGTSAVKYFFVLSGFLITYLMLHEQERTGAVAIRAFYMRRIRRTWPLYFAMVIFGLLFSLFVIEFAGDKLADGGDAFGLDLNWGLAGFFLVLLPNVVIVNWASSFLAPLWSLGVEEQFYAWWGPTGSRLVALPTRRLVGFLAGLFVAFQTIQYIAGGIDSTTARFVGTLQFQHMIAGAIGATLVVVVLEPRLEQLSWITRPLLAGCAALVLVPHLVTSFSEYRLLNDLYIAATSTALIVLLSVSDPLRVPGFLRGPVLERLGTISFGIYVFHTFFIVTMFRAHQFVSDTLSRPVAAVLVLAIWVITVAAAELSYRYFEHPIIKRRHRPTASVS